MRDLPDRDTASSERHKAGLRVLRKREEVGGAGKALLLSQQGGVCARPGFGVASRPPHGSWCGGGHK